MKYLYLISLLIGMSVLAQDANEKTMFTAPAENFYTEKENGETTLVVNHILGLKLIPHHQVTSAFDCEPYELEAKVCDVVP